jgi:hypothetical protein
MGVVPIVNENDTISVSVRPVSSIDPLGLGCSQKTWPIY